MSSDTSSAIGQGAAPRAPSAAPPRRQIRLIGKSAPIDPTTHAARRDLADIALAGRVFSQHYAVPMAMRVATATVVRSVPQAASDAVETLAAGDAFHVLDLARDWAWGYGDASGSVGYIDAAALATP